MSRPSAAKLRFIRANPEVAFLVDNHLVTKEAPGAMMQGNEGVSASRRQLNRFSLWGPR